MRAATGVHDDIVPHAQAKPLVADWCAHGADVTYVPAQLPELSEGLLTNRLAQLEQRAAAGEEIQRHPVGVHPRVRPRDVDRRPDLVGCLRVVGEGVQPVDHDADRAARGGQRAVRTRGKPATRSAPGQLRWQRPPCTNTTAGCGPSASGR